MTSPHPPEASYVVGEIDRRQLLKKAGVLGAAAGGLWVAPSVLTAETAWAFGSCTATISTFPTTNANTNTNGWTRTITLGTFSPGNPDTGTNGLLGISPTYQTLAGPCFLSEDDPTVLNAASGTAALTYTTPVNVVAGHFYRFTFSVVCTAQNTGAQILDVLVGGAVQTLTTANPSGVGKPSSFTTDNTTALGGTGRVLIPNGRNTAAVPTGSNPGVSQAPGSYQVVYHALATGSVNFTYQFTLNTTHATNASDDIAVSSPTIECSLTGT